MKVIRDFIGMKLLRHFNWLCWCSVVGWIATGKGLNKSSKCGYCLGCFSGLERERYFTQSEIKRKYIFGEGEK